MMFPFFIVDLSVRCSFALLGLPAKWSQGLHCKLFDYALRLRAYSSIQKAALGVALGTPTHLFAGNHRYKPLLFESASRFAQLPAINARFLTRCETMRPDCRDQRKLQNPFGSRDQRVKIETRLNAVKLRCSFPMVPSSMVALNNLARRHFLLRKQT